MAKKKKATAKAKKKTKTAKGLTKRESNAYKRLLLQLRERIAGEINHIAKDTLSKSPKDASGDISGYTYHIADVATDSYDREFSLGIASSERKVLYEINDALKRIEEGSYGACLECGRKITKMRLRAIPHTKYCIKCQQGLERGQRAS